LANSRISSISVEKGWADYAHDVFDVALFAQIDSLLGLCAVSAYGFCWQRYDADMIASIKEPYLAWHETRLGANQNLGYGSYVASANAAISNWNNAKTAQSILLSSAKGSNSGCIDSGDDQSGVSLENFVLTVDCDYGEPISEIINITSTTPLQDSITISKLVKSKWDLLDESKSPICSTSLFVTGLISFSWEGRGYIDTNGVFYYFTRNHLLTATGGARVPEDLSITITVDGGRAIFKYPSEADYAVNVWPLGTVGEDIPTEMVVKIAGRAKPESTLYGVTSSIVTTALGVSYLSLEYSSDPYAWIYRDRQLISEGYSNFAGMYYDHPIITRVDVTDTSTEREAIADILSAINSEFTYEGDEESFDSWSFMNSKNNSGDCEDFAITTIQRMLDAGFSISRLKLAMGWKDVSGQKIGHAWVVLDDTIVLDRTVKSISDMNEYNIDRMLQVDGNTFLNQSYGTFQKFNIRQWEDFSATVFTMTCNLTRNVSATPAP
jgi:predicted transglutaminase-like cysteine proteinase